jgi:hypothetical protein
MIRRGIFKYFDDLEIEIVGSVAKQILERSKNDLEDRWNVTPDLVEKAQRIVELVSRVSFAEPEVALGKRDRPLVKRPPRPLCPASITDCGSVGWSVRVPFRDPDTGKARIHYKTIRPSRKAAQVYLDWYSGLLAAGEAPKTVSQTELQDLAALERKAANLAATLREKLLARVVAGGRVQPGLLVL